MQDSQQQPGRPAAMDDLLNAAPCGFVSFAEDGRVVLVNDTLIEMLGYAREDVVGHHLERLLSVGSRIFYQTHWFPLLRLHGRAEEIFLMMRSAAGENIGVLSNARRRERHGRTVYDCILMQVRERQKYEGELLAARRAAEEARVQLQAQTDEAERLRAAAEEANHAKSAFLAVMSHELRTPLNAIAGYLQILEMGIPGPVNEAQREILGRIGRSERHLLRLINDVLNLARIEAGHVDYVLTDVRVEDLVRGVVPMVEPQMLKKGIRFETRLPPAIEVHADVDKAQQLLLNLLGNATKFTPAGGGVTVEAEVLNGGDAVEIRVHDTGIGIPPDKLDAIFQPFVQVDVSRTRSAEGSGLGLAISRDLARGMGGELTATSIPGKGSTFTFMLPTPPTMPQRQPASH